MKDVIVLAHNDYPSKAFYGPEGCLAWLRSIGATITSEDPDRIRAVIEHPNRMTDYYHAYRMPVECHEPDCIACLRQEAAVEA